MNFRDNIFKNTLMRKIIENVYNEISSNKSNFVAHMQAWISFKNKLYLMPKQFLSF